VDRKFVRPEKDQPLQIKAMYELRQIVSEAEWDQVRLLIIGGCRGPEDEKLVQGRGPLSLCRAKFKTFLNISVIQVSLFSLFMFRNCVQYCLYAYCNLSAVLTIKLSKDVLNHR
jgi:hypothetical protein